MRLQAWTPTGQGCDHYECLRLIILDERGSSQSSRILCEKRAPFPATLMVYTRRMLKQWRHLNGDTDSAKNGISGIRSANEHQIR